MQPACANGHNMRRTTGAARPAAHTPINNPSYATNPTMWHAVAMQQQRLAEMKLSLGPPRLRPSAQRQPGAPAPPRPAPPTSAAQRCGECSGSDDDEGDDGTTTAPAPQLTLAQRMGLAEAPEPELTPSEWDAIAAISRERDASRQPCVICQEEFRNTKQVLLSCGHVFHRACLRSWERHSKSRCCPVCRKLHYRKRAISDGVNLYMDECATRIQAVARGVAARRTTSRALRHANPQRLRRYPTYLAQPSPSLTPTPPHFSYHDASSRGPLGAWVHATLPLNSPGTARIVSPV